MKVVRLICILIPLQLFAQIHSVTEKYDTDSLQRLIPVRKKKNWLMFTISWPFPWHIQIHHNVKAMRQKRSAWPMNWAIKKE